MKRIISTFIIIAITLILLPPASADLNDGLVAFWPFYGNAHDESGNGNDGVVYGATLCEDRFGTANSAYCFDGVDDYINIGNDVKPPFPITVSAWVKPYDLHYNGCIFRNDRWDDQSYRYGLATMYNGMGESRSHVFEGFSACWNRRSKTSNDFVASTGNWHHFVVVFHAHDDMRHFWNGIALDGHSECFGSGMTYSSADGAIGHNISPTGDRYVKAAIDDIRVYNRALSEAEIQELYRGAIKNPIAEIIGTWSSGIWYWDAAASSWTKMYSVAPSGDIAAGDFTGDKKADVASCWPGYGLYYQNGATLGWTKVTSTAPDKVTAGDVTGDGRAEIIGTWSSGIWYWNVAASKWTQMYSVAPSGDIAAGDFTGDGKADVASNWSSGLWFQNGATLAWTKVLSTAPGRVTAGDVTDDGRAEIIGTWDNGIWYRDVAKLEWIQMTSYSTQKVIAAGDFTGDGKADVASCWDSGLWYQNGASLSWTNVSSTAPSQVTAGDVTGD